MKLKDRTGLTLVESLVSMLLLGILMLGVSGSFFISKYSVTHARHRYTAMKILKSCMEQEMRAGYYGGSEDEQDYYETVTSASPVPVLIDDRGTVSAGDDLMGTIVPDPYFPDNYESGGVLLTYGVPYKIIGFVVTWTEDVTNRVCTERAVSYVSLHTS